MAREGYGSLEHALRFGHGGGMPGSSWPLPVSAMAVGEVPLLPARPRRRSASSVSVCSSRLSAYSAASSSARSSVSLKRPNTIGATGRYAWSIAPLPERSTQHSKFDGAAGCASRTMGREAGRESSCRFHQAAADVALGRSPPLPLGSGAAAAALAAGGAVAGRTTTELARTRAWDSSARYHGMRPGASCNSAVDDAVLLGGRLRTGIFGDDVYCRVSRHADRWGELGRECDARSKLGHLQACGY
eukprot:TRINITY_DN30813_c0_g1_i1.p1 TRINITY_DN30813_c0_g1~~TRINITY_DN30813_c0_g1_i1.p1  ORF type:complete len:245 (+),score=30.99 TRINITY_DN30813_c0_g1_i1:69-803(+)